MTSESKPDMVNHPPHYTATDLEPIVAMEAWQRIWPAYIAGHLFTTVKYLARAGVKGDLLEDLEKAHWYLTRAIGLVKKERGA